MKPKFRRVIYNPANQKLTDFVDEPQKLATDAFRVDAQAIFEQFMFSKIPPHQKTYLSQANFENGTYEQIVSHPERKREREEKLKLISVEASNDLQMNTVTQRATKPKPEKPK